MDKYKNLYENIFKEYPDKDDTLWLKIDGIFEDELCKIVDIEQAITIDSALRSCNRNYSRKPYIIMVASLIEQLFNDYFRTVINNSLLEYGSKVFIEKYDTAGIQSTLKNAIYSVTEQ